MSDTVTDRATAWTYKLTNLGWVIFDGDAGIASVHMPSGVQSFEEAEELSATRARILASAPALLAALEEAEAGLEMAVSRLDNAGKDWPDATERLSLKIVRAAIAAAREA